jgi:hypothetical protein
MCKVEVCSSMFESIFFPYIPYSYAVALELLQLHTVQFCDRAALELLQLHTVQYVTGQHLSWCSYILYRM